MGKRETVIAAIALAAGARADVYMQYPPGGNNRLDEGGGNRNNNNRLMDTQNNAKGGYGYGGDANNPAQPLKYMAGSKLSMTWTSQHSCGSENAECQIVIQYMCNDAASLPAGLRATTDTSTVPTGPGEGPLRDGTNNNTPDPDNPNQARGLHEPTAFYQACENRERNKGLYTSDQNLNGNDATKTRQNPNGARSGLECPEERDYYPYWAPSPWKDLMVMTNNLAQCSFYQQNSQNVASKGYCTGANGNQPISQTACTAAGGTWHVVQPFSVQYATPAPQCVTAPVTRDNHLGNDRTGNEVTANLTIPSNAGGIGNDAAQSCVIRLRYNITTADTRACSIPSLTTEATCVAGGGSWSALYVDSSMNDNTLASTPPLPDGNPKVSMGGFLNSGGGTNSILELAVNTNQYGRTFQDRTHAFSIQPRPLGVPPNANIYNLNVKGKRGNIVQTYPATEYDFHPVALEVGAQDLVHIQWTGNDNTNNNGNNNGEGVNNEDRHNIVQLDNSGLDVPAPASQADMFDVLWEWNPEGAGGTFGGARDKSELQKQAALSKQTNCDTNPNNDQQRTNCEKLNNAAATVDLGLLRFKPGSYKYMSSRNNNFSNRAQKAKLTTLSTPSVLPGAPTHVTATPVPNPDNPSSAIMQVTWQPPGEDAAYMGTDGTPYHGYSQEAQVPIAYTVQYSCDGGETWTPTNCQNTEMTCRVEALPAGTACAFRVRSGSSGGWSFPSETAVALTEHTGSSQQCAERLLAEVNGDYIDPATIAGIVVGVIAGILILLCCAWYFLCGGANVLRRSPPPPPPGDKFSNIPPPPPN